MRSAARPKALVAAWFDFLTEPQRQLAESLQAAVRQAVPEAVEIIKWGNLVFVVDDAPLMALVPFKSHVNLQIFNGSQLPPSVPPLDGGGRGSRSLRCRLGQPLDGVEVQMLVLASVSLARRQAAQREALNTPLPTDEAPDL